MQHTHCEGTKTNKADIHAGTGGAPKKRNQRSHHGKGPETNISKARQLPQPGRRRGGIAMACFVLATLCLFSSCGMDHTNMLAGAVVGENALLRTGGMRLQNNTGPEFPEPYRVMYDVNWGGLGTSQIEDQLGFMWNDTVVVRDVVPVRPGRRFTGWNTAANGSGTPYKGGDTFLIHHNVTLYAQWNPTSYTWGKSDAQDIRQMEALLANPVEYYPPGNTNQVYEFTDWVAQTNGNLTQFKGVVEDSMFYGRDLFPSLDGKLLCYCYQPEDEDEPSLYLAPSGGQEQLVTTNVKQFRFLKHNKILIYLRRQEDNSQTNSFALCRWANGKEVVLAQGKIDSFCVSMNGKFVLYVAENALYTVSTNGDAPKKVADIKQNTVPACISNDGMVYWYFTGTSASLIDFPLDLTLRGGRDGTLTRQTADGDKQTLSGDAFAEFHFNYSGTEALLCREEDGLWIWQPSVGFVQCSSEYSYYAPRQAGVDGNFDSFFYVTEINGTGDQTKNYTLHRWSTKKGDETIIENYGPSPSDFSWGPFFPNISQDGTRITYTYVDIASEESSEGLYQIIIAGGTIGEPRQIAENVIGRANVSSDGKRVYYRTLTFSTNDYFTTTTSSLYYINVAKNSSPTLLAQYHYSSIALDIAAISADGSKCVYTVEEQKDGAYIYALYYWQIGQKPIKLATGGFFGAYIANNGGVLYWDVDNHYPRRKGNEGTYFYKNGKTILLTSEASAATSG